MSSPAFESLRAVNHSLRARMSRLSGEHPNSMTIVTTEFSDLLVELQRATQCLRNQPKAVPELEMANEISEYRSHLQQLGKILPSVQGRLLIEKARLENARTHGAKAAAWAEGSKKTL